MASPLKIYWAGGLFDHTQLFGNILLAEEINRSSEGKFAPHLPQDIEQVKNRSVDVRNGDISDVITSDMAVFNFNGTDLDSGTVVEFMLAKFLDIPSVILRTDFRQCGEQDLARGGDPWNPMCSFWPRTEVLCVHGMALYQEALHSTPSHADALVKATKKLALLVIERMEKVLKTPSIFPRDAKAREAIYRWVLESAGGNMFTPELLQQVLSKRG